jgi:hypothetical protein
MSSCLRVVTLEVSSPLFGSFKELNLVNLRGIGSKSEVKFRHVAARFLFDPVFRLAGDRSSKCTAGIRGSGLKLLCFSATSSSKLSSKEKSSSSVMDVPQSSELSFDIKLSTYNVAFVKSHMCLERCGVWLIVCTVSMMAYLGG